MKLRVLAVLFFASALGVGTLPAQDWAKERLNKSPRHSEWVELKHDNRSVKAFIVYPEAKSKTAAVLVVHEIFGLTDWAREMADEIAAAGCIAIVPDLLTEPGKDTQSYPDQDAAVKAVSALQTPQVMADLDAAADYVAKLPACDGTLAVTGFCWGGGRSFQYANHNPHLKASYVFYGTGPTEKAEAANITCPVYGFYAEEDARIGATVPPTAEIMRSLGKTFEPVTYAGAGHGFMRAGEAPDAKPANRQARDDAWKRWKVLLKGLSP
ncbi:MAG: dienelactone hydrolase family protein [Chthoniobacterales bacterium]|nr:dienelactone hydrolase family protein [Chthoniobacterales bacterium]